MKIDFTCPHCDTEITFWTALKQPTPFRFKCSKCKTKYTVAAPHVRGITFGAVLCGILLGFGFFLTFMLGAFFFYTFFVFAVGIWLTLELWSLKYIARFGTLTIIRLTGQDESAKKRADLVRLTAYLALACAVYIEAGWTLYFWRFSTSYVLLDSDVIVFVAPFVLALVVNAVLIWRALDAKGSHLLRLSISVAGSFVCSLVGSAIYMIVAFNTIGT